MHTCELAFAEPGTSHATLGDTQLNATDEGDPRHKYHNLVPPYVFPHIGKKLPNVHMRIVGVSGDGHKLPYQAI